MNRRSFIKAAAIAPFALASMPALADKPRPIVFAQGYEVQGRGDVRFVLLAESFAKSPEELATAFEERMPQDRELLYDFQFRWWETQPDPPHIANNTTTLVEGQRYGEDSPIFVLDAFGIRGTIGTLLMLEYQKAQTETADRVVEFYTTWFQSIDEGLTAKNEEDLAALFPTNEDLDGFAHTIEEED